MRKFDRNAVFNICLKTLLFAVVFLFAYILLWSVFNLSVAVSLVISAVAGILSVLSFSFLLRYTKFYFSYYSFVSAFLFKDKKGDVYCPCCDKHFRQFRDNRYYDDPGRFNPSMFSKARQDVICDFCRSAPRHRIIAWWAEQNIDLLRSSKVLLFAPELSMMLWFKRHGIHVVTADLFDKKADIKLDLTAISLPDESEDIVFCNHVLEHVPDPSQALSELHRIIRKGGSLIISFPIDFKLDGMIENADCSIDKRIRLFGQYDHLRVFGKDSAEMLENAGFEVDTIRIDDMPESIAPVTGPADYDTNTVFCCIRK